MDIFEDITVQLMLRAKLHDDAASITLKGHLLSEHLINRIIEERIRESKKYRHATYSQKLKLMEKHCLLTEEILKNLRLLNDFRNKMAHDLDVTIVNSEMVFFKPNKEIFLVKPKKGRYPQRFYLRLLCGGVLTQLRNHMLLQLKIDPRFRNSN
jgi:hypothetical protein